MITEITNDNYTTQEKLQILADAAKYDVACTSSGSSRRGKKGELGNAEACGICHSFAADGRCISLLKILMTNHCAYDCKYCINRASNDVRRATFTPQEICELTVEFYKRNYIEGLFLSSGVLKNPTYTMEKMCETLLLLRTRYHFNGYIHVKTIPGASDELLAAAGYLADRYDVDSEKSAPRANERVKKSVERAFEETVTGYATVMTENSSVQLRDGSAQYALLPVWILNTTWEGKHYLFAMNGQTGKFVGDLPADKNAARKMTIKLTVIITIVVYILRLILWMFGI